METEKLRSHHASAAELKWAQTLLWQRHIIVTVFSPSLTERWEGQLLKRWVGTMCDRENFEWP